MTADAVASSKLCPRDKPCSNAIGVAFFGPVASVRTLPGRLTCGLLPASRESQGRSLHPNLTAVR